MIVQEHQPFTYHNENNSCHGSSLLDNLAHSFLLRLNILLWGASTRFFLIYDLACLLERCDLLVYDPPLLLERRFRTKQEKYRKHIGFVFPKKIGFWGHLPIFRVIFSYVLGEVKTTFFPGRPKTLCWQGRNS